MVVDVVTGGTIGVVSDGIDEEAKVEVTVVVPWSVGLALVAREGGTDVFGLVAVNVATGV
jgi:hypothetical protein